MSRRVEVTVPNAWAEFVREVLEDPKKCNYSESSEKPHMIVEVAGAKNTIFFITVPGPAVSTILEVLRSNGIGTNVGRIILTSLDFLKPDLSKPLAVKDLNLDNIGKDDEQPVQQVVNPGEKKKPAPLKGFAHFQKARKTTEEMYNDISTGASMTINTWMNLIGACLIAAGGLTTNVTVFIVAAMLVSPIMGPILGMTFGYRVGDWPLFRTGFINEIKMAGTAWSIGALFGICLGDVGNTYKWPNSAMMPEGQEFNLIISCIVSAAAGMVLGVSLTATGGNALVGTAISAGLLPPLVNAGMLMAYSYVYAEKALQPAFYEMGKFAIFFYFTHVVTIIVVANIVFWLKDIDPRFREGEDSNFNDIPSLVEHRKRMQAQGKEFNEKEKANFFIGHMKEELTDLAFGLKDKVAGFAHLVADNIKLHGDSDNEEDEDDEDDEEEEEDDDDEETGNRNKKTKKNNNNTDNNDEEEDDDNENNQSTQYETSRRLRKKGIPLSQQEDDHNDFDDNNNDNIEMKTRTKISNNNSSNIPKDYKAVSRAERDVVNPMFQGSNNSNSTSTSSTNNKPNASTIATQQKIYDFYAKHNPNKYKEVPDILQRYKGKEEELLSKLHKQYGVTTATSSK